MDKDMRFLYAVKSCSVDRDRGAHQLIRDTWGKDVGNADLRFFIGIGSGAIMADVFDEVGVLASDDYRGLPFKTRQIVNWALCHDYDYIFLTDTGSFVIPHHVAAYDFANYDYMGYWGLKPEPFYFEAGDSRCGGKPTVIPRCYPWASGGGYILSRKAMDLVAAETPKHWAEDCSVSQILAAGGILLEDRAKDGYNGYIVTWIHNENNSRPDAMERRRKWMEMKYIQAKSRCEREGCNGPSWDRKPVVRGAVLSRLQELEQTLEERRKARHGE
jgi:Galactosyltransferase